MISREAIASYLRHLSAFEALYFTVFPLPQGTLPSMDRAMIRRMIWADPS